MQTIWQALMEVNIMWVVTTAIGLVTLIGGVVARDRYILNVISKNHEGSIKAIQESADTINARVDHVKDEYVRRVDLDGHISRLDGSLQHLTDEMRSSSNNTNQRLDMILAHFVNPKSDR